MNSIYIISKTLLARKDCVEILDKCGAVWWKSELLFSERKNIEERLVSFDPRDNAFFLGIDYETKPTHIPDPEEFCRQVAKILGIEEPVFGNDTNVVTTDKFIESEQAIIDKAKGNPMQPFIDEMTKTETVNTLNITEKLFESLVDKWHESDSILSLPEYMGITREEYIMLVEQKTITDNPEEFMAYVAKQTRKEWRVEPKNEDKCMKCGNPIGNTVFTVCDNCWDVGKNPHIYRHETTHNDGTKMTVTPPPTYPHKTYRILDSLDDIPFDTRIPLSEWVPPFGERVCFVWGELFYSGVAYRIDSDGFWVNNDKLGAENVNLDGHWMRIV